MEAISAGHVSVTPQPLPETTEQEGLSSEEFLPAKPTDDIATTEPSTFADSRASVQGFTMEVIEVDEASYIAGSDQLSIDGPGIWASEMGETPHTEYSEVQDIGFADDFPDYVLLDDEGNVVGTLNYKTDGWNEDNDLPDEYVLTSTYLPDGQTSMSFSTESSISISISGRSMEVTFGGGINEAATIAAQALGCDPNDPGGFSMVPVHELDEAQQAQYLSMVTELNDSAPEQLTHGEVVWLIYEEELHDDVSNSEGYSLTLMDIRDADDVIGERNSDGNDENDFDVVNVSFGQEVSAYSLRNGSELSQSSIANNMFDAGQGKTLFVVSAGNDGEEFINTFIFNEDGTLRDNVHVVGGCIDSTSSGDYVETVIPYASTTINGQVYVGSSLAAPLATAEEAEGAYEERTGEVLRSPAQEMQESLMQDNFR